MKIKTKITKTYDCDYMKYALIYHVGGDREFNIILLSCGEFQLQKYLDTVKDPTHYEIIEVEVE